MTTDVDEIRVPEQDPAPLFITTRTTGLSFAEQLSPSLILALILAELQASSPPPPPHPKQEVSSSPSTMIRVKLIALRFFMVLKCLIYMELTH